MFIQDLKLIKSSESHPRVWSPQTQSREPDHKSGEEKLMWPYTSEFNPQAKNHSRRTADTRWYLEVQTFTPVPYQSHLGVFNFHTACHSPLPPPLWVKLFFDISITLSKAAVPRSVVLWSSRFPTEIRGSMHDSFYFNGWPANNICPLFHWPKPAGCYSPPGGVIASTFTATFAEVNVQRS